VPSCRDRRAPACIGQQKTPVGGDLEQKCIYIHPLSESPAALLGPISVRQKRIVFNLNTQGHEGRQATQKAHNANQALSHPVAHSSPGRSLVDANSFPSLLQHVERRLFTMWGIGRVWVLVSRTTILIVVQDRCVYPHKEESSLRWGRDRQVYLGVLPILQRALSTTTSMA